ncbi:MAG: hypothetical protein RLN62_03100 [Rickettsiales bacterium]
MPQVLFEHSKEIGCSNKEINDLFKFVIDEMVKVLGVTTDGIKLRSNGLQNSQVGMGNHHRGFLHLTIAVLKKSERTQGMFDDLGNAYLEYLAKNFSVDKECISVEFREMDSSKYYKY